MVTKGNAIKVKLTLIESQEQSGITMKCVPIALLTLSSNGLNPASLPQRVGFFLLGPKGTNSHLLYREIHQKSVVAE